MEHLDHLRARCAVALLSDPKQKPDNLNDYLSVIRGAAGQVRSLGLLQVAAFWKSKTPEAPRLVLRHLLVWLSNPNSPTYTIFSGRKPSDSDLAFLVRCHSREIALMEREAERFLGWLSRIAKGQEVEIEIETKKKAENSSGKGA